MESSCQGFLPRVMEQGTEDREDDAGTSHEREPEMLGGTETVMEHPRQTRHPCLILWHFSREDDGPTLPGAIHAIIARALPRAILERLARCKNG